MPSMLTMTPAFATAIIDGTAARSGLVTPNPEGPPGTGWVHYNAMRMSDFNNDLRVEFLHGQVVIGSLFIAGGATMRGNTVTIMGLCGKQPITLVA